MRPRRALSIILIAVGVIMVGRSFILVNEEIAVEPDIPVVIRSPSVMRFWGRVETDSMRMGFQVVNESNYEGGTSLIKTRWTKNLSFDVNNGKMERIYFVISNTNVDPTIQIGARVRSYGLAPLSPWLLVGLCLSIAGIIILIKKERK